MREAVLFAKRFNAPGAKKLDLVDALASPTNMLGVAKKLAQGVVGPQGLDRDILHKMKVDLYPRSPPLPNL